MELKIRPRAVVEYCSLYPIHPEDFTRIYAIPFQQPSVNIAFIVFVCPYLFSFQRGDMRKQGG